MSLIACYSCAHLDDKKKKEGKVSGCAYYCKKKKKYVSGSTKGCDKYEKSVLRNSYKKNDIFREGEKYCDTETNVGFYSFLAVVLFIILIIVKFVFKM